MFAYFVFLLALSIAPSSTSARTPRQGLPSVSRAFAPGKMRLRPQPVRPERAAGLPR
jgi:hypothetical protein